MFTSVRSSLTYKNRDCVKFLCKSIILDLKKNDVIEQSELVDRHICQFLPKIIYKLWQI